MMKKYIVMVFSLALSLSAAAQSYKELREDLSELIEALDFHPDSIDLRLRKAGVNIQLEQWQYAREEYDRVLAKDSDNVAALFYRAFVNGKLQRYKFARADYESLLKIVPTHFEGRLGLVLLNQKDNHRTEALDQINKLIELYPDSAVAYAVRGGIEEELGMRELAEEDYGKAVVLEPLNTDYRLSRANTRIKLKRPKEAREDLDELVRMGIARIALSDFYDKCK